MKTTLITITMLFIGFQTYCQSLNFNDLVNLYQKKYTKEFLLKKNFSLKEAKNNVETYVINPHTTIEEQVWVTTQGISYWSLSPDYIKAFVKEARKKYRIMMEDKSTGFYNYGDIKMSLTININNRSGGFSTIAFIKRH